MGCHERAVTPPAPGVLGGGGRALYGGGKNASLGLAASSLSRRTNRTSFFSTSRRTHSVCGSRFGYPSYLLHARQVHGFRHRQLVRGGHRPAFRLRCFDGRVTRCQRACGDKTYAEISIGVVGGSRNERRQSREPTPLCQPRRLRRPVPTTKAYLISSYIPTTSSSAPATHEPIPVPVPAATAPVRTHSDVRRYQRRMDVPSLPSCARVSSTRRAGFRRVCMAGRVPRSESSRGDFASLGRTSPETASRYAGAEPVGCGRLFSADAENFRHRGSAVVMKTRVPKLFFADRSRRRRKLAHGGGAADPAGPEGRGGSCDVRMGIR